jgi:glutaredoxin
MIDRLRDRAFRALRSSELAMRVNDALGRPLASQAELDERRAWESGQGRTTAARESRREQAPVVIFHLDKHNRLVAKMTDILKAAGVAYTVRNVDGDEPATEAALRDAGKYGLPFVMVGATVLGGVEELADADHNGELTKLVWSS